MAWRKVSAELSEFLNEALAPFNCQKKMMFGCPAYFVGGNMFAGVHQEAMMIRLSEQDRTTLLSTYDEATVFEPMAGRPMKEYIVVPDSLYNDPKVFGEWLDRSFQYVSSLPPKEAKNKAKPKAPRKSKTA